MRVTMPISAKTMSQPGERASRAKSWRDVIKIHPAADFPRLQDDELVALGEDIRKRGLHSRIVVFNETYGNRDSYLLDGVSRLDSMEHVGIKFNLSRAQSGCW